MSSTNPHDSGQDRSSRTLDQRSADLVPMLLELVNDLVLSLSIDAKELIYVNRAGESIYGLPLEALEAEPQLWLEMVHPEDQAVLKDRLRRVVDEGEFELEFRVLRRDDTERWLQGGFRLM
ncbi:MAG: PAS domain-containing protein, partial [Mariniblastus sp.]|nr:PAS domain-containing protein [Mariniblastus sp.]